MPTKPNNTPATPPLPTAPKGSFLQRSALQRLALSAALLGLLWAVLLASLSAVH